MLKQKTNIETTIDYQAQYDGYWSSGDRIGESSGDMDTIAEQIVMNCGMGRVLEIGSGEGLLVASLLRCGVDAHGVDVSEVVTARCNQRMPTRFTNASVLALPFEDSSFQTVVSTDCMEHLAPEDVPKALQEIHRVAGRYVYLQLATTLDRDGHWHLTVEGRAWWETKCFEAGFRKHPAYYKVNPYESLNDDGWQITIILEKIPGHANTKYPITALAEERDLHMDMLREVGERSDAHVARYLWAEKYVRQGDRILDAACGLGYGSHTLAELSKAKAITGVDGSDYAIDYARENFSPLTSKLDFFAGYLPECLGKYPDGHFDVIVSFETLEHVEHPEALLKEFHRLLSPGGRIVVSVPNDWSDETGEDPNPFHLHVYTLDKLRAQIKEHFIPEALAQQIASGCKTTSAWNSWQRMPRTLQSLAIDTNRPPPSEWWLMVGMKDPVTHTLPYRESVYGYSTPPDNLLQFERDYNNPWLVRSMLEFHFRATNKDALGQIAQQVLERESETVSADKGAALAVVGYQLLGNDWTTNDDVERFIANVEPYVKAPLQTPHLQRFHVSLSYLKARLLIKVGRLDVALPMLKQVANADLAIFSPTLGSKVVDAAFEVGLLEASRGEINAARASWKSGVERAYELLASDMKEFIGDINNPLEFPTIVAVEFLDSAVRCIKALRVTSEDSLVPLTRLYELTRENWKGILEERWNSIKSMESMIRDRDEVIAGQARMLEERWTAIQSMESMIRDRDEVIAGQARMLEERWTAMQSMESMIRDRDTEINTQKYILENRLTTKESIRQLIFVLKAAFQYRARSLFSRFLQ